MAVLEKIRKRSMLLIVIIGLSLLAFILSSLVGKGSFTLFGDANKIGEVNGETISLAEFSNSVQAVTSNNPNASIMNAVNSVWNREVNNIILEKQFDDLGIQIDGDRIMNLVKQNPQIAQDPRFLNENGVFDPQKFRNFIADMKAGDPAGYEQWKATEENIIASAKQSIFYDLIQAGLGVTEKEGEVRYAEDSDMVNFTYVQVPYTSIADSTVTVSDSEIKSYINEHKEEFEEDAKRDVRFVVFEEKASEADLNTIKDRLNEMLVVKANSVDTINFVNTTDLVGYTAENSEIKFDSAYVQKSALPKQYADTLYSLKVGQVYGPYEDGDYFKISRMVSKKANGNVKASHILIAYDSIPNAQLKEDRSEAQAETLANSLMARIKKGEDVNELAKEFSEDPGVASNNGTYDNIRPGQMVPEFDEFIFNNPVGSVGVVKTQFGFHVIKVEDQYETVSLATVALKKDASQETINDTYNESNKFLYAVTEEDKDFEATAKEFGQEVKIDKGVEELAAGLTGVANQRSIVRWAFEDGTSVGDIKKFNVSGGYAIVQVTGVTKEGLASVESAKAKVMPILLKEKKAAKIINEAKGKSMEEIEALYNIRRRSATDVSLSNPAISGAGAEPKVVGTAFGLNEGGKSGLIEGEKGVYMVEVTKKEDSPKLANYTSYRNSLRQTNIQKYSQSVIEALKKSVEIEDNRAKFY
ncbi:peptidylprolyl isomerase [Neptunitalea lumnitzerae]|uniref:Periplasmic chaperone PpiD n=1 Tax=Neptunitalea lumnitzerae TaxID=2965509 RepID=A0ABQ5MGX9_9FLAO|nr:peptidylprolyl isomerase [Neptunitalea sp. Y10]GLB48681.1 peptidylprolyl isomerase [Neptunitalea sp. Y10]